MADSASARYSLTRRERQCLSYLAKGLRLEEAAEAMGVSRKTAEKQLASAKSKLSANTREHAVAIAIQNNLLFVEEAE